MKQKRSTLCLPNRRNFNRDAVQAASGLLLASIGLASRPALALSLSELTQADASKGLKQALENGIAAAIASLGKTDGFFGNSLVKIGLPSQLEEAAKLMRRLGQGGRIDELILSMNRAAEQAVPMAKTLLVNTAKNITVTDAKNILSEGEGSATKFFAEKTRSPLGLQFLPVVNKATEQVGVAEKYNQLAGKLQQFGLMKPQDANIQQYVTHKALDGLYLMMAEQEKKIRQDPIGTGSDILAKVFGAIKR
jgi:hypothetical protein